MNSNYETLYGIHLLDDLHNYFPALLYDSSGFRSVQDVLNYIQQQTRNRFDLFSYGLREYASTNPPRVNVSEPSRRVVRTSFAQVPPIQGALGSTLPTPVQNAQPNLIHPPMNIQIDLLTQNINNQDEDDEEETEDAHLLERTHRILQAMNRPNLQTPVVHQAEAQVANALLSLLQIPPASLTTQFNTPGLLNRRFMDEFLQPVPVRPTAEQIANNTTVGNLVSDTEHTCAICQDNLAPEQEGRKLNACGHWFHRSCIDTWLQGNVHCPVCRHDIREAASMEI